MSKSKDLVPLYSALDSILNTPTFDNFFTFHQFPFSDFLNRVTFPDFKNSVSYPKANCYLTEDSLHFEIIVAGFSKEDIDINREGNNIIIKADKQRNKEEDKQDEKRGYIFRDLAKRNFTVTYKLSDRFDYSKIDTKLENGILYISIPIKEEEKPKTQKIEIK